MRPVHALSVGLLAGALFALATPAVSQGAVAAETVVDVIVGLEGETSPWELARYEATVYVEPADGHLAMTQGTPTQAHTPLLTTVPLDFLTNDTEILASQALLGIGEGVPLVDGGGLFGIEVAPTGPGAWSLVVDSGWTNLYDPWGELIPYTAQAGEVIVNEDGTITVTPAVLTVIPEPVTALLLLAGGGVLLRRRVGV